MIATTPNPPYYAVIFTSLRTGGDNGYDQMAERMMDLAKNQIGFLGVESVRSEVGITVSYWKNLESIKEWKLNSEHLIAQEKGKKLWYASYKTRICRVEKDYNFDALNKG